MRELNRSLLGLLEHLRAVCHELVALGLARRRGARLGYFLPLPCGPETIEVSRRKIDIRELDFQSGDSGVDI